MKYLWFATKPDVIIHTADRDGNHGDFIELSQESNIYAIDFSINGLLKTLSEIESSYRIFKSKLSCEDLGFNLFCSRVFGDDAAIMVEVDVDIEMKLNNTEGFWTDYFNKKDKK